MVQRHPPTPPSVPAELQYDLHHLVQHNTNTPYKYDVDESQYAQPTAQSAYATPGPIQHQQSVGLYMSPHYNVSSYPDAHGQSEIGLGISIVSKSFRLPPLCHHFHTLNEIYNVSVKKAPC